jgi:hypothetical protein
MKVTFEEGGRKMNSWKRRIGTAWLALGVSTMLVTVPADAGAQAPAVNPEAVRMLKRMTDHLAGLQQFKVRAHNIIEDVHSPGHRVDYDVSGSTTVKRPDKLRFERTGELNQRFYYDGKAMTLHNPLQNVYATQRAPDTIEKMIQLARETIRIVMPAADLVYRDAFPRLTEDLTLAVVVGEALVNGVKCDHLLFSRPGADFQVCVARGKRPWPMKYVVTETDSPSRLSITTYFSDWNAAPEVDDAQFKFVPPKGATAIEFMPLEAASGPGR